MGPPSWKTLGASFHFGAGTLAEMLDGGQAFRWKQVQSDSSWIGAWDDCVVQLRIEPGGRPSPERKGSTEDLRAPSTPLQWRSLLSGAESAQARVEAYLGGDRDWTELAGRLPWRSDAHLARCMAAFPGLRILRQPFGETLLGFLCSATKQIVQIKQMMALLAERCGGEIGKGHHRLPTWEELARCSEADLRRCLLGFRARYIHQTALFLARNPGWLDETAAAPYAVAKERLCELPGVGEKVADCVLLFGAGRLEAFPVDVWVLRALAERYGLEGWKPRQVAHFGRTHFGPLAGLAQQYLFGWERRHGKNAAQE